MADSKKYVEGQGWLYVSVTDLYADAQKANDWYECTGMKVATPPAMPRMVASWILRNVKPYE